MSFVILIGRILFSAIFVGSAIGGHFGETEGTAGYAESRGVSNAHMLTIASGALIGVLGLAIILGIWIDLAALGIIGYLLVTNVLVHHFWTDEDPMTQQMEMTQFMKNLSIAGGALMLFAFFAVVGDAVGLTVTGPLFEISGF